MLSFESYERFIFLISCLKLYISLSYILVTRVTPLYGPGIYDIIVLHLLGLNKCKTSSYHSTFFRPRNLGLFRRKVKVKMVNDRHSDTRSMV